MKDRPLSISSMTVCTTHIIRGRRIWWWKWSGGRLLLCE